MPQMVTGKKYSAKTSFLRLSYLTQLLKLCPRCLDAIIKQLANMPKCTICRLARGAKISRMKRVKLPNLAVTCKYVGHIIIE